MPSGTNQGLNPGVCTIRLKIHRCTNVTPSLSMGLVKRDYFIKISFAGQSKQTEIRRIENNQLVWDVTFEFNMDESSSMKLGLYYTHAIRKPTVVGEYVFSLPEAHAGYTSPIQKAVLSKGPEIEFSFHIEGVNLHIPAGRTECSVASDDGTRAQKVARPVEFPEGLERKVDPVSHDELEKPDSSLEETTAQVGDEEAEAEYTKAREAGEQATQVLNSLRGPTDVWKRVLEGIGFFSDIASFIAEVNPYASMACSLISAILKHLIEQIERDDNIKALLESFSSFCEMINVSRELVLSKKDELSGVLKRTSIQMTEVAYFITRYSKDKNFFKRVVSSKVSGTDDIIEAYRTTLEELKDEFRTRLAIRIGATATRTEADVKEVKVNILRVLHAVEDIAEMIDLKDIPYVQGAGFNQDKICLVGTRTEFLKRIARWVNLEESRVLFVSGGAGTGKSTIAHTLASQFKDLGRLGSMFCFSESEKATRNTTSVFRNIARDLASLDEGFRAELCRAAQNLGDRTTSSITAQFEMLCLTPAKAIQERSNGPIVIVIDALDESGTAQEREKLVEVLATRLKELPSFFRVIITSRPEQDIENRISNEPDVRVERMHAIPLESTNEDIIAYITHRFDQQPEITPAMCRKLASHAHGLFQWAYVACDFVRFGGSGEDALDRFEELINPLESSTGDQIVLPPKRKVAMENFKFVMARVLTALEPLSSRSLNKFITVSRAAPKGCTAEKVLAPLGSLLSGVNDQNVPIRPLHTSFRDFLRDPERSERFFVDLSILDIHCDTAWVSLSIMKQELKFNICHLPTSHLANKDIPGIEKMVQENIPPHLSYACRFWGSHLSLIPTPAPESAVLLVKSFDWRELVEAVNDMLCDRFLYWLEALSLLDAGDAGLGQIRRTHSFIKAVGGDPELALLLEDAEMFYFHSAKCIATSAAHIYVSSLPFAPKGSLIASKYTRRGDRVLSVVTGKLATYPPCLNILHHTDSIWSVAFSPAGTRIASGSSDHTIQIWNAQSGEMVLGPLRGHTSSVLSVAFSPNGSQIVSGSSDSTIRIWNAQSGETVIGPLEAHTDPVWSVVFSPDGARIASGSEDHTIRIWDARSGEMDLGPLEGHTWTVLKVVFSSDGTRIASCSLDIRIWDARSGQTILRLLEGHPYGISSIALSPDGTRIASALGKAVQIWNTQSGEMVLKPLKGHKKSVSSLAFSPDGSRIASGSDDNTIRIWDAQSGKTVFGPIEDHTDSIWSVVFSPDSTRLASASQDNTIRIWNAQSSNMVRGSLGGQTGSIRSMACSPDGTRIASGSLDHAVRIWDVQSGEIVLGPLEGHTDAVSAVAFSSDGARIASCALEIRIWDAQNGQTILILLEGQPYSITSVIFSPDDTRITSLSLDSTIQVWDAQSGEVVLGPLECHPAILSSVALSPDGTRIASGSLDNIIQIWNAQTGEMVLGPLEGHADFVWSVAFSPDGSLIASGSEDRTIQIRNAQSGEMVLGPLEGHTEAVWSVAFSPNGTCIASGSEDATIRIWSVESGQMVFGPLHGYTASSVSSVAFLSDGTRIASCSSRNIYVHDLTTAQMSFGNSAQQFLPPNSALTTTSIIGNDLASHHDPVGRNSSTQILPQYKWRMKDGWSLGPNGELLFYVPPTQRNLCDPMIIVFIGDQYHVTLDMSRFVHGSRWTEAFSMCGQECS